MTRGTSPAPRPVATHLRYDDAIARWLLAGPAQIRSGREAGAVAGTLTGSGAASYVYPEIAGYYLQWLAWRARNYPDIPALAERAGAVQRWLGVWLASGDPPRTRVHLDGTTDDWRNRGVFCFDLAMVLRGLASAAKARLLVADAAVVAGVARQLGRLVAADGQFDACAPNAAGDALPDRWSTRRGGFLAKAAAGIITAARALDGIPAHVARAATVTFDASVASVRNEPHRDAHPLLYAFEGIMALPQHPDFQHALPALGAQFDELLASAGAQGYIPETRGAATTAGTPGRVDVIAQTLRIGYLLNAHRPQRPPDRVALARLRRLLEDQVQDTGALAFGLGKGPAQCNVWATMFADQALAYAVTVRDADSWWRTDPMLV